MALRRWVAACTLALVGLLGATQPVGAREAEACVEVEGTDLECKPGGGADRVCAELRVVRKEVRLPRVTACVTLPDHP